MCRFTRYRFPIPAPESHRSVAVLALSRSSHSHIPIGRLFSCQRTNIPSLITSGSGCFFGCFENFLSFHLFPQGKAICTPIFKKYLSFYIGLLKNPSEINPLRILFSSLLYRNFFASILNLILKIFFLFTYYTNPEVISGGIAKNILQCNYLLRIKNPSRACSPKGSDYL